MTPPPSSLSRIDRRGVYLVAGVGLIVGSLFAGARGVGGLITLVYFLCSTSFSEAERAIGENLENTLKTSLMSHALEGVTSFLILFLGGRWLLRGPRLLDRWLAERDSKTDCIDDS